MQACTRTFSKDPWNIRWKGGRYKEARLSRGLSDVDEAPWSDSQTSGCFISSSKLRNAINGLGSRDAYPILDALDENVKEITQFNEWIMNKLVQDAINKPITQLACQAATK